MPIDRTAQAAQLARILDHAGEPLTFNGVAFSAAFAAWQPAVTDTDRNVGDDTCLLIEAARGADAFAAGLPRQGEYFRDSAGRGYRVQSLPSLPATSALVHFICAVSPLA